MMPIPDRPPRPKPSAGRPPAAATLALLFALLASAAGAQEGQSTFGHARARELAALGRLPTAREIVVPDLLNYHRHRLPLPSAGAAVALDLRFDRDAAQPGDEVWLQVGYATRSEGDRALSPPCAVALVIDCSGSMAEAGKLTAVQAGLAAFVARLRPDDQVALVAFATEARVVAPLRARGDGRWLAAAIAELRPDGNTNLHAGVLLGLDELRRGDVGHRARRLVLLTDGIANTGVTDPTAIADDVAAHSGATIDVATIGVGENLDTPLLQRLAETNRGLFHFVGDREDVAKVFVREADSLLVPVARRVTLALELPSCLQDAEIFGARSAPDGLALHAALPDLNAGATGVVLVRCRVGRDVPPTPTARATLQYLPAEGGDPDRECVTASAALPGRAAGVTDLEVRKNAAIAVLAAGLHTMAEACDAHRWADADRALRLAVDEARRLFPGADDDVRRVHDLVAGHQRTLARYVDRFRDG